MGKRLPIPADYAELAPTMLVKELCEHYSVGAKTLKRWIRDTGVGPRPYRSPKGTRKFAPKVARGAKGKFVSPILSRSSTVPSGRDEDAAHFLRRFYPAVHHCTQWGGAKANGKFWRCGMAVLTSEQLIARAMTKGWDPDEWARIAA